jgi:hypothetical protein
MDQIPRAPVVLLAHCRPLETKKILEIILESGPRPIFCFVDGPRPNNPREIDLNVKVSEYLLSQARVHDIRLEISESNLGIKRRLESGLDLVYSEYERAIVLEDDCIPNPTFFKYCDELLELYKDDETVGVVSGFNPLQPRGVPKSSYFASSYPLTWGWASWRRVWVSHDPQATRWKTDRKEFLRSRGFSDSKVRRYWRYNLNRVSRKEPHQIWDYQFTWSQWSNGRISIVPSRSLIQNIGFSAHATHTVSDAHSLSKVQASAMGFPLTHPKSLSVSPLLEAELEDLLFKLSVWKMATLKVVTLLNLMFAVRLAVKFRAWISERLGGIILSSGNKW